MRSSRVVRASDSQCRSRNCPGFDPSILRHSGIIGAADEAVLNIVQKNKKVKKPPFKNVESTRNWTFTNILPCCTRMPKADFIKGTGT
jgi:hypothetical protein